MYDTRFLLADLAEMLESADWRRQDLAPAGTVVLYLDGEAPGAVQLEVEDDELVVDFSNGRDAADVYRFDLGAAGPDSGRFTERIVRVIIAAAAVVE